jgi:hypothetical protein
MYHLKLKDYKKDDFDFNYLMLHNSANSSNCKEIACGYLYYILNETNNNTYGDVLYVVSMFKVFADRNIGCISSDWEFKNDLVSLVETIEELLSRHHPETMFDNIYSSTCRHIYSSTCRQALYTFLNKYYDEMCMGINIWFFEDLLFFNEKQMFFESVSYFCGEGYLGVYFDEFYLDLQIIQMKKSGALNSPDLLIKNSELFNDMMTKAINSCPFLY